MRLSNEWKDYECIDAGNGEKLERWGNVIFRRPDPQAMWPINNDSSWKNVDGFYHRSNKGGGYWDFKKELPEYWTVSYKDLTFKVSPTNFKHTGIFPEQAVNWDYVMDRIKSSNIEEFRVLNLFAYTGGATIACLKAGASVTHVDASKGMVSWAKENAVASKVDDRPVRWLVDDCLKFIAREIRRGNKYDGIVMDPPSYGRGPNGEVWKIEQQLDELLYSVAKILSDDALFFLLNSYSGGISPTIINYMVKNIVIGKRGGEVTTDEIGLKITDKDLVLPCGCTTVWMGK